MEGGGGVFDLYKLLVEEVRETRRARRELSNAFLTLNLGGVGALGFLGKGELSALGDRPLMVWFSVALTFMCWIWSTSNRYYTHILKAKYDILYDVERKLERQPIAEEWEAVRRYKPRHSFSLEYSMPVLFPLGYAVFLAYQYQSELGRLIAPLAAMIAHTLQH